MNSIRQFCPSPRLRLWFTTLGTAFFVGSAIAQTTNITELRELRVACLESFNNAQSRLEDLHAFVDRQASCEHSAAEQLFQLKQNAATDKRRNTELQQRAADYNTRLEQAKIAVEQATTSYRAALDSLPNGEAWAAEGSSALSELRRNADAATRSDWKHKRVKEVQEEFIATLSHWRAARRSIEQANFDLELRAAPNCFKRVADQIAAVSDELKTLEKQLTERQTVLADQSKQSERWGAEIRTLRDGEAKSRKELAEVATKFHLVDLKFAAWRLKHSADKDLGLEALPDVLEKSVEAGHGPVDTVDIPGQTRIGGNDTFASLAEAPHTENREAAVESEEKEPDPTFAEILARVNLAQARLAFVSETWNTEVASVRSAISQLETLEEKARILSDDTARLAADQETLRRSLETENRALASGAETLDLVQKRFITDLDVIEHLLKSATDRTATLAKRLEK